MTILFAGAELDAFVRSSTGPGEVTTAGTFNATFARCAIRLNNGVSTDYIETVALGSQTTIWLHWDHYQQTTYLNGNMVELFNSSGTSVFRLRLAADSFSPASFQAQYWNGSAWTNIGSAYSINTDVLNTFDLKVVIGASGGFELYRGGSTLLASASGVNLSGLSNVNKARFNNQSYTPGRDSHVSQVMAATTSLVGHNCYSRPPTGNSTTNTGFTGDYTAVDETTLDDADYIQSTAAGDVETYTHAAITIASGTVKAVVVTARVKNDGSSPQNAQAALRIGSTNYFSSNLPGIGATFGPAQAIFETDPSTGAGWTAATAGSAATESGLKSVA